MKLVLLFAAVMAALLLNGAASEADTLQSRGAYLARAADCIACHTLPGGKPFAGGFRLTTPLGSIYSDNITPDKETGIGNETLADFERALRRGIARDGHQLYPAMPYPSYAKLTDQDVEALYGFFMKEVTSVRQEKRPNDIPWPLDMRWPLAIWNALFLDTSSYRPRSDHNAEWNRGAYLVEGAGHCGACHTPRGVAWNEQALDDGSPLYLSGGVLDFWSAPNLREDLGAGLGRWSTAELVEFLKTGHNREGTAFGSMVFVVRDSTPYLSDADLEAIAAYLKSLPPSNPSEARYAYDDATVKALHSGGISGNGELVYLGRCASCHGDDGRGKAPDVPPLAGNPTVLDADPASLVNIVLNGASPSATVEGTRDPQRMPEFRTQLSDERIAEVVSFIRGSWGNRGAAIPPAQVGAARRGTSSDQIVQGSPQRGASLVARLGCGACHAIPGIANADGLVGPPLDNIGSRTIIAGLLANTPRNMVSWLKSPQSILPGNAMPNIGLTDRDAGDIAIYLDTLRE